MSALALSAPSGRFHEVTGSSALDMTAFAANAAEAWERPVQYQPIGAAEHIIQMASAEDPWWLYAYSSMFASIREHRWDRVTDEVQQLTGQAPLALADILNAQPRPVR
jgi:NAD(P)H dehydrogenase (quinone)